MDRLPQIPKNGEVSDTACVIRSVFQENLEAETFPIDIADNIRKYVVDDHLSLKQTAQNVFEINEDFVAESEKIKETELEIIKKHGEYLFNKNVINKNEFLRELSKLKSCDIFINVDLDNVAKYGLIQKCDLYPDITRQFLDFRFNTTLHRCKRCFPLIRKRDNIENKIRLVRREAKKIKRELSPAKTCFKLDPDEVVFIDFEVNNVYEHTVKIINTSSHLQSITVNEFPKLSEISLIYECQKIAAGMSVNAKIRFKPKLNLNLQDKASFRNSKGQRVTLPIKCQRNPPKLHGYIYRSNDHPNALAEQHIPGSKSFSKKRQTAVNDTIDCGSCFVTDYILINIVLMNSGNSAKFFWMSENNFYQENVSNISTELEFCNEGFWIYPTYFEILKGQTCEISIIFQPMYADLHVQTLFLMCDNNTYHQVEIVGESLCFNRNMISVDIPLLVTEIERKEGHCIYLGHVKTKEFTRFTLSINNLSSLTLKYYFKNETKDQNFDMSHWIQSRNKPPVLAPYSVTDVIFEVEADVNNCSGYYNTALRLFIQDVPVASLNEEEPFFVDTNNRPLAEIVQTLSVVDVLVLEVEVTCYIEPQPIVPEENKTDPSECKECGSPLCSCQDCGQKIPPANLVFAEPLIDIGILPPGVDIKREFCIMNLGEEKATWNIAEIKYDMTAHPYIEIVQEKNVSSDSGTLSPGNKQVLSYSIVNKQPVRWVSILVLFSISKNEKKEENQNSDYTLVAESICVLTYEITTFNIVAKTGQSDEPILCPLQMLYTGVPVNLSFKIQNYSLITGCFYFLRPVGNDAEKVQVKYEPQFGELKPGSTKKIRIKLTCDEVGILENIFLPCFIGKDQKPVLVRLLCVVDCIHVFFYLPNKYKEYQKILWPPKVMYEYDRSWSQYCICEELAGEYENTIQNIQSENALRMMDKGSKTVSEIKNSNSNINNVSEQGSVRESSPNLLETLENVDSEIFLQDYIMQVENVITKQPRKITIYFENLTPKSAKYTIQSTNYVAKENLIEDALTIRYKTTEELWEPMLEKHGILVQPQVESGTLKPHELVSANIWIYANTWGIYTDEIVVDIEDIACFTFSLIIEIVGCPLQVPLSLGAITKYPTIRFGSVTFGADDITKNIVILNNSSIDVNVSWHMFYFSDGCENDNLPPFNFICDVIRTSEEKLKFDFTERFFGIESSDCVEVEPSQLNLASNGRTVVPITFKPWALKCYEKKCFMKCYILGRIFMTEEDRFKSSYFYRKYNSLIMEVTATIEQPSLDIKVEHENSTLYVYANDVTLNRETKFYMKLNVRNSTLSTVEAELDCSEPFSFDGIENSLKIKPGRCQEIQLPCLLSYEKIIKWAPQVYKLTEIKEYHQIDQKTETDSPVTEEVHLPQLSEKNIDEENKILSLQRKLFVYYQGGFKDVIPLHVRIYYPNIAVKPTHVKFGYLLIGRTQKTSVSVFNLTGCRVVFEIYKSLSGQEITVTPSHGEIDKSTGINHSSTYISIYFTPTESRTYQESIRIVTNIPQHYIDIPIKGTGSSNEKFDGSYKI